MLEGLNFLLWGLVTFFLVVVSYFLAKRSMKDFEELPDKSYGYSLFLIRNLEALGNAVAQKIYTISHQNDCVFSFERLSRGGEQAVVLFMPSKYAANFPELNLLEIEDYLIGETPAKNKITKDKSFIALLKLATPPNINIREQFSKLELKDDEMVSFQIVTSADASSPGVLQATLRCLIYDNDPTRRIEIAKLIINLVENGNSGIIVQNKDGTAAFEGFLNRTYTPKEVAKSLLKIEDILSMLR